jgi:hypothetical protein
VFVAAPPWKLEVVALRHQVAVLRRQRSGRLRLLCADRPTLHKAALGAFIPLIPVNGGREL